MTLYVVTGAPGCGKSTWVRNTAKPGDIRFGGDELTNAITGKTEAKHHHDNITSKISRAAREAGIREAIKHQRDIDIFVLVSNLSKDDERKWRARGASFVIIDPGREVAMERCRANRPGYKHRLVNLWYDRRDEWPKDARIINPDIINQDDGGEAAVPKAKPTPSPKRKPKTTTERGYGYREHQVPRERLLRRHKDGAPCWWCGLPMYREAKQNWDEGPLALDHPSKHGARNGEQGKRLLHDRCNKQAGDHSRDDDRPALTGRHPSEPLPPKANAPRKHSPSPGPAGTQTIW